MTLPRMLRQSRHMAADMADQIRNFEELSVDLVPEERTQSALRLLARYFKYRGLYLERLFCLSQVRSHQSARRAEKPTWALSTDELLRFFQANELFEHNSVLNRLEDHWQSVVELVPSQLDTREELERYVISFAEYCDAIATTSAISEAYPIVDRSEAIGEIFARFGHPPTGRFASAARHHCRTFALSEKLYPWRRTANGQMAGKRYPLAMIQSGLGRDIETPKDLKEQKMEIPGLELNPDIKGDFDRSIEVLKWRLKDWDWEEIIEELFSDGGQSGDGAVFDNPNVNVIPGVGKAACQPIVFALASGIGRKRTSLGPVLVRLSEHLAECESITQLAVLVTDTIDPKTMQDRRRLFEIYQNKGVKFVLLLVRGKELHPLPFF